MVTAQERAKKEAKALRDKAAKLENLAGITGTSERERDAERKRKVRAAAKTVYIPPCQDLERRKRLEADDEAWLLWYFGPDSGSEHPFWYEFTEQQKEMIAAIRIAIRNGEDQSIAASRGEGKTTYCERMILKYLLQGIIKFGVLFAATGTAAQDSLESIKLEIETNERLLADYPEVCVPVRALENTPNRAHYQLVSGKRHDNGLPFEGLSSRFSWCGQEIFLPVVPGSPSRGGILATRGLDAAVRGLKKNGRRPDVAVIDDPDTDDTARSEDQAKKLEDKIDRGIAALGGQKRRIGRVMLSTIQNRTCVSFKFTDSKQKPSWKPKRFRFLIKPPDRLDLWQEYIVLKQADWVNGTFKAQELYESNRAEMDRGAIVANPNRFTATEFTALEFYYSEVARIGPEAVACEYDNDPPEDENVQRLVLTAYHIQNNCLSGLEKREVPDGTVCITRGGDVQKLGLHHVTIAWNEAGAGSIIDYDFFEFLTEGKKAADCELLILEGLHAWYEAQLADPFKSAAGEEFDVDLTLIDTGWKDETWSIQPVHHFCAQVGFQSHIPSKGWSPYRRPSDSDKMLIGDNWHISFQGGVPTVIMNSDHYKLKLREGFMLEAGQPGAITLHLPAKKEDGRRDKHMSFAKHILNESWQEKPPKGFGVVRSGFVNPGNKPNHYGDAAYQAIVGRSMRRISPLATVSTAAATAEHSPVESYVPSEAGNAGRSRW